MDFIQNWPWIVIVIGLLAIVLLAIGKYFIRPRLPHMSVSEDNLARIASRESTVTFGIRILISLTVLFSALYVILSGNYADAEQKWAFASIGTIVGYWLKT